MNTITTVRADVDLLTTLKEVALWFNISAIKNNWLSFTIMRPNEIFRTLRQEGAYTRPLTSSKGEVHVSLTKITNKELVTLGLVPNVSKFIADNAVAIMEAGLGGVNVTHVRDGLMKVTMKGEHYLVVAQGEDAIHSAVFDHVEMFNKFAYQWAKWQATAKVVVHDGKDILKFENGLSVRMELSATNFCQTGWEGEYEDFCNPYEFYWWLKRFF